MFRKLLLPILIATIAVTAFASDASAQTGPGPRRPKKHTPWEYFQIYSQTGATLGYTGYQYCYYARQIALTNGYDDGDTQGSFYYGEAYSWYAFVYGYYGFTYGYKDWVKQAADLSIAAENYEKGIYDYLLANYYNKYPSQLQHIMDTLNAAVGYEDLAEKYYTYSITFVEVPEEASAKK